MPSVDLTLKRWRFMALFNASLQKELSPTQNRAADMPSVMLYCNASGNNSEYKTPSRKYHFREEAAQRCDQQDCRWQSWDVKSKLLLPPVITGFPHICHVARIGLALPQQTRIDAIERRLAAGQLAAGTFWMDIHATF